MDRTISYPPHGGGQTLTFLIADVRGYTRFGDEQGDEAAARLAGRFADLVEDPVERNGGTLLELRGDEALAVFPSTRGALHAAVSVQEVMRSAREKEPSLPLHVGIGLDVGEAIPVRGGYRGNALNLAARLCSIAGPGEIFASEGAIHLARYAEGLAFVDRGEVRLKGLQAPVRVFQIAPEEALPESLPPLQPILVTHPTNLPDEPTPFIGRQREIFAVTELLRRPGVRLVTLTGPGGCGKTRLALQAGAAMLHARRDGVYFVSLGAITDPALVLPAIAEALETRESGAGSLLDALATQLKDADRLLVIDNFEHLLSAAPQLTALLDRCRSLQVLVTSRTSLNEQREYEFPVPPLSVPDPRHLPDPEEVSQFEAVAMFMERAEAAGSGLTITAENAQPIAEICTRLDGLPLAIELAAARTKLFSPQALLGRLDRRLAVLTGGSRDLPYRQQTLRATIDWSFSLLTEQEKTLFARLSVFAGGCSYEAIEAVCDPDGTLDLLDSLASLVNKSLLRQDGGAETRFSMLETIREYAAGVLDQRGEVTACRLQHAQAMADLMVQVEEEMYGAAEPAWLRRLDVEHENIRAALIWSLSESDGRHAAIISATMWRYWETRGQISEGRRLLEAVLEHRGVASAAANTPKVRGQSTFARILMGAGNLSMWQGDLERARALHEQRLAFGRRMNEPLTVSLAAQDLGIVLQEQGKHVEAAERLQESLAIIRELGNVRDQASVLNNLGITRTSLRDFAGARAAFEEAHALCVATGNRGMAATILINRAETEKEEGQLADAAALCYTALETTAELGMSIPTVVIVELLSVIAAGAGNPELAARLWGIREALRGAYDIQYSAVTERDSRILAATRADFGAERWDSALLEGLSMDPKAAIDWVRNAGPNNSITR